MEWSEPSYNGSQHNKNHSVYKLLNINDLSPWAKHIAGINSKNHVVIKEQRGAFVIVNKKSIEVCSNVDGVKLINKVGDYSYFDYELIKEIVTTDSILYLRKNEGCLLVENPECYYLIACYIPKKFIIGINMHSTCKSCTKECKHKGNRCEKVCSDCLKYPLNCNGCKHNEVV